MQHLLFDSRIMLRDYCSQFWCSHLKNNADKLEGLQKRAPKVVKGQEQVVSCAV